MKTNPMPNQYLYVIPGADYCLAFSRAGDIIQHMIDNDFTSQETWSTIILEYDGCNQWVDITDELYEEMLESLRELEEEKKQRGL